MTVVEEILEDLVVFRGRLSDAINYNEEEIIIFREEIVDELNMMQELIDDV